MDFSTVLPVVLAQVPPPGSSSAGMGPTPSSSLLLALLALRRWCGSLTLSQPDSAAGAISTALWVWLLGLAALLVLVVIFQGPVRAIGQLLDVPGHARLLEVALGRFRRSGRMLAITVGISVLAWTTNQTFTFGVATGRDDELLLTKGRDLGDVALNQGYLAAMTPLRDVVGLGLMIPLLIAAAIVLFQFSTDRWGSGIRTPWSIRRQTSRWATIGWGSAALVALYRFVCLVSGNSELPIGGCAGLDAIVVPILTALADGVIVAWVVVELRNAGLGDNEGESLDVVSTTLLIPASALACVLLFPARYVGTAAWLVLQYLPANFGTGSWIVSYLRWQLGWGLADLQAAAVVFAGLFGAVAWSRGTPGHALKGYFRMLSAEGGRLVVAVAAAGVAAGAISSVAYRVILALPSSTWALNAADSYAHYGTLPIGLILLAALVELGERSLPLAALANHGEERPLL